MNSSFSTQLPSLQLAIDSTSLGTFKECPRKYYYSIVLGRVPKTQSAHLSFGLWLHQARETYDQMRSLGAEHQEALRTTVEKALRSTWNRALGRGWISDIPEKTRLSLIRTIVWYLDELGQNDPIETIHLANGKPAVELSFRFFAEGCSQVTGEPILLCGHMDRIGRLGDNLYGVDIKTTKRALDPRFFAQFSPDNQMSLYTIAGKVAFGQDLAGMIIDGIQVGAGFARFQRGLVPRTKESSEEWMVHFWFWQRQMENCAESGIWPLNDKSCGNYGGCPYQSVCGRAPQARERWLEANFSQRSWDPLQIRG
jgi:hypothetical protein